jgi:hypothetical protein
VAAGALDASGRASIVVSKDAVQTTKQEFGSAPGEVAIFSPQSVLNQSNVNNPKQLLPDSSINAYPDSFLGGVRVAVGDATGQRPIIVTAPGAGAALPVLVFDAVTMKILTELNPYGPNFQDGIYVAAGSYVAGGTSNDIVTSPGSGLPLIKVYDGAHLPNLRTQVVAFQADQSANVMGNTVPIVTSVNEQAATGFQFKISDPDPAHPNQVATAIYGTSSVALGNPNPTGTLDLLVGHGIGQKAITSTISVNGQSLSTPVDPNKPQTPAPVLPKQKKSMFFRQRSPRGVNLAR